MEIRKPRKQEQAPMNLVLLADPSRKIVEDYLNRGACHIAETNKEIIGVYSTAGKQENNWWRMR